MITVNDNSVPQINAALLRLESGITQGIGSQVNNISVSLSSDINALKKRLSELSIGTMVYSAGDHINISSNGVISVTGISEVAETGSYNDLIDTPTDLSDFNNDVGYITESDIPTDVSAFNNDAGYIADPDYVHTDNNFTDNFETGLNSLLSDGTVEFYLCETQSWIKNKVARVNVQKEPKRQGYFYIWFKRLNWYYDGTYCKVSFSDDPDTAYNIRVINAWNSGNYGTYASCCFGCGVYMARIVGSAYCYVIPLDFKSYYVPYYGSNVTPTESEDFFKTTPVETVYTYPVNNFIDASDNTIRVLLPTMFINSSTRWFGYTSSGSSGSYYGSYNGVPFPAAGQLINQGEYNARRGPNEYAHRHITSLDYQGYTEYSGTVNLTQSAQTLFTHPATLVNKVAEITLEAQVGNYTFAASGIFKSFASGYGWVLSGYVGSSALPVIHYIGIYMLSNGNFNISINPRDSWTVLNNTRYTVRIYN